MLKLIRPITEAYTRKVDDMCELLFVYLATGETKQIPKDWLGAVYTNQIFVEPPRKRNCRRHYSCRAGRVEFCASQTAPTWLDLNS
jgi:ribosomal protein S30